MAYTETEMIQQREQCMTVKAFLKKRAMATNDLRTATTYAETAALVDAYLEALEAVQRHPDPRCPTCGVTMCQQFDETPVTELAVRATPNGNYRCYHGCGVR